MLMKYYHQIIEEVKKEQEPLESEEEREAFLRQKINHALQEEKMDLQEKIDLAKQLFYLLRGFGSIQPYIEDSEVNEIMILGKEKIYIEKKGAMLEIKHRYYFEDELKQIVQRMASRLNKQVNEKNPICDLHLSSGERVNIVMPPIAAKGPMVTIRKFPKQVFGWEDLLKSHTFSLEVALFLQEAVRKKYNIFVSGGTSSGKTTLLNVLASSIPAEERIITIEDARELRIEQIPNQVNLECRQSSFSGEGQVTASDLIKAALRMRPDRIIVGEVRAQEAIDMLQAMNTGHSGSLSTGHSNSAADMVKRLETMVLSGMEIPIYAIRSQIASAIDLFVHLEKIHGKGRRIVEICQVAGIREGEVKLEPIYQYFFDCDSLVRRNNSFTLKERWERIADADKKMAGKETNRGEKIRKKRGR